MTLLGLGQVHGELIAPVAVAGVDRRQLSGIPGSSRGLTQGPIELDHVTQRDSVVAGGWHFWLDQSHCVHRIRVESGYLETVALKESLCNEIVVRGEERESSARPLSGQRLHCVQECRANSTTLYAGVDRDDLASFVFDRVGEHPDDFIDVHRHESAQFTNVIRAKRCDGDGRVAGVSDPPG